MFGRKSVPVVTAVVEPAANSGVQDLVATSIPRHAKVEIPLRDFCELLKLDSEAREFLGYKRLGGDLRLNNALQELGIEVLDPKAVKEYKAKKRTNGKVWTFTPIGKYDGEIPEFVLHKAIQLKKRLPEVNLSICQLTDGDPFLFAAIEGYGYYIEVWDEPEFESKYL